MSIYKLINKLILFWVLCSTGMIEAAESIESKSDKTKQELVDKDLVTTSQIFDIENVISEIDKVLSFDGEKIHKLYKMSIFFNNNIKKEMYMDFTEKPDITQVYATLRKYVMENVHWLS